MEKLGITFALCYSTSKIEPVYVYDPANPPETGRDINVKINLVNSKYISIDSKQGKEFILYIADPDAIGLSSSHSEKQFANCLILSCNLVLKRTVFSQNRNGSTRFIIERNKKPVPKPKVTTSSGRVVAMSSSLYLRHEIHIIEEFEDELDEIEVLRLLSKILALKNDPVPSLQTSNLQKSVDQFQSAMFSLERSGIFKQLFSSLEISTNCDGVDRTGKKLVQEASRISGITRSEIENCLGINNRLKHADKTKEKRVEYQNGVDVLGQKIICVRGAAQKIIISKLESVL